MYQLEKRGYEATFLPVDLDGGIDLCDLQDAIRPDTAIVSLMWANNETGVLFPVEELAAICRSRGVLFHTDAIQVAGKIPIDVQKLGVDFLSLSAHKLRAPKGIGLLYVKPGAPFRAVHHRWRAGARPARRHRECREHRRLRQSRRTRARSKSMTKIRGCAPCATGSSRASCRQFAALCETAAASRGCPTRRTSGFDGVEAEAILLLLDREGICASSGSACTTGSIEPSHVLQAMGVPLSRSKGSLRFSLGLDNTEADVDWVIEKLPAIVSRLRDTSPEELGQAEERLTNAS